MSQEVSNWLVNGLYPTYKWGSPWGYNPLTNLLLTSWDIQVYGFSCLGVSTHKSLRVKLRAELPTATPARKYHILVGCFNESQPDTFHEILKGILAAPPKATPPRNKGLIAGLIKGNQWLISR